MWNPFKKKPTADKKKSSAFAFAIKQALGSGQPGQWASDHRSEAEAFTGWTYVAVRAICLQATQATVSVFDDSTDATRRRSRRKSLRNDPYAVKLKSLYAGDKGESEPLPNDHPLCKLLKRPNPTQSGAQFRYERVMQLQLTGTCIVWNVPNKFGKTVQRYVIPTAMATPVQPTTDFPQGGYRISANSSRYAIVDEDGFTTAGIFNQVTGRTIPLEQLQVTRWPHPHWKDDGQSPVSAGAKWIDSANQIDSARWAQMNNGADPSIVLTLGAEFNGISPEEVEAAQKKLEAKYAGTDNTGKIMITNADDVVTLTTTPRDMSYVEAFTQLRDAGLALHGVPGIAAGITDGGSYAAFYASLKQFICLTVQPILDLLAEDDTERFAPQFGPGLTIEIEAAQIDDPDVLEKRLTTDLASQAITKNEVRALRGLPPVSAEKGGDDWAGQQAPAPYPMPQQNTAGPFATGQEGPPKPDTADIKPGEPTLEAVEVAEKSNVQSTALNGAQVQSLVELATSLSQQRLPYESVKALIVAAFPLMDVTLINEILKPLLTFKPPEGSAEKSHRFLSNGEATAKAQEIVSKAWRDYPGGRP